MSAHRHYDVIVVGAGPAGASAARAAAAAGASVLLLEEHARPGRPIQCTGLLSTHGISLTSAAPEIQLRAIRGATVWAPDGSALQLGGKRLQAIVIDRDRLDEQLVDAARTAGADVLTGVRAVSWRGGRLGAVQLPERRPCAWHATVLIGADGAHSRVAGWAKLPRPSKRIYGVQVLVPHTAPRKDFVEVWLGRAVAPNFFAWSVPAAGETARVGLGTDDAVQARRRLHALLEERFTHDVLSEQGGTIPLGLPKRTVADGVLLAGDAAGQAKPTSGGGIYTGALCGRLAGEVAAQCVRAGDVTRRALNVYERRWRRLLERELQFGWQAHRMLCRLGDAQLNRLFAWLARSEVRDVLEEHGDIDYPSACVRALLERPTLWKQALKLIPPGEWLGAAQALLSARASGGGQQI